MAGNRVSDKEEGGRGLREGASESLEEAHDGGGDSGRVGGLREGAQGIRGLGGRGSGWGADGAQRKSRVSLCLSLPRQQEEPESLSPSPPSSSSHLRPAAFLLPAVSGSPGRKRRPSFASSWSQARSYL